MGHLSKVWILMIRLEQIPWLILVLIAVTCAWQVQFLAGIVSIISLLLTPHSPKFLVYKLLLIKNIDKRIDENVNHWYTYGVLMRAKHNNTKTNVRSLPYRVALRCETGFFGFQREMGRGSKWDMWWTKGTRGTQWDEVNVEGRGMKFTQYKGRTQLWEAYKVMGKQNVGEKAASYYARSIHICKILLRQKARGQCTHVLLTI